MKNSILLIALLLAQSLCGAVRDYSSVTLEWDPPTDSPVDVTGYKIHWGPTSGNYTNAAFAGTNTTGIVDDLLAGATYYFAVTSLGLDDTNIVESEFSNEVFQTIETETNSGFQIRVFVSVQPTNAASGAPFLRLAGFLIHYPSPVPPEPTNPPPAAVEVIVDNNIGTNVTFSGSWYSSTNWQGYYGLNYRHDNNTKGAVPKTVAYHPYLIGGSYTVSAWHPSRSNLATNVPVEISHAAGTETVYLNLRTNGGQWNLLGTYTFAEGTNGFVRIRNDTIGFVAADAFKWTPVP